MATNVEYLSKLKEQLDEARSDIAKNQGKLQHFTEELKNQWKCEDIISAKKKLEQFKEKADKLGADITLAVEKLRKAVIAHKAEYESE